MSGTIAVSRTGRIKRPLGKIIPAWMKWDDGESHLFIPRTPTNSITIYIPDE